MGAIKHGVDVFRAFGKLTLRYACVLSFESPCRGTTRQTWLNGDEGLETYSYEYMQGNSTDLGCRVSRCAALIPLWLWCDSSCSLYDTSVCVPSKSFGALFEKEVKRSHSRKRTVPTTARLYTTPQGEVTNQTMSFREVCLQFVEIKWTRSQMSTFV